MTEAHPQRVVLSIFQVAPRRIGGVEMLAAELSRVLRSADWRSILVFPAEPTELVRDFLSERGAEIMVAPDIFDGGVKGAVALTGLVRKAKARHLYLSFVPILSLLPWAGKVSGAKHIYFTDQGSRPEGEIAKPVPLVKRMLGRFLAHPYKQVFCISNYVRNDSATRGYIATKRLTTLYNSIDFRRVATAGRGVEFRRKFSIGAEKILVSQVSWLRPEKGLDDLLNAAAIALKQDPRLHFLIAGDGAVRDQYVQLSQNLGLGEAVTFAGLVEDPMSEGLYAASDITCQLSRWQEAFAWVIAEAMAHGKPVIGTKVGGIPEVIDDNVTGYVVAPSDPSAVAERIVQLSRDPALRARMGLAGYNKALKDFNLVDNVPTLLAAIGLDKGEVSDAALANHVA